MSSPPGNTLPVIEEKVVNLQEIATLEAQKWVLPSLIVVNEQLELIFKKGDKAYFQLPDGYVSYNLLNILPPEFHIELRKLVSDAQKSRTVQCSSFIPYQASGKVEKVYVKLILMPVFELREPMYILYFQEITSEDFNGLSFDLGADDDMATQTMALDLERARENMQVLLGELESTNEELQSTNEELQSSNEELQSTNEELETSNEELQSTNEELQSAYTELKTSYDLNDAIKVQMESLNKRYESVLENMNDGVVVSSLDGEILKVNRAMTLMTGYSKDQLLSLIHI